MTALNHDLEILRKLNDARDRAKQLREQGLPALKAIKGINEKAETRAIEWENIVKPEKPEIVFAESDKWVISKDKVETALLVKVQNHRDISENEDENNRPGIVAAEKLKNRLTGIRLEELIQPIKKKGWQNETESNPSATAIAAEKLKKYLTDINFEELIQSLNNGEDNNSDEISAAEKLRESLNSITAEELSQFLKKEEQENRAITVPVLVAARAMQALVKRAETVFEPATMLCYYRIIRELYGVAQPNWTVGAARAGVGGTISAFITNECLRAIFAFRNTLEKTYKFFEHTYTFYQNFISLKTMLKAWGIEEDESHPLYIWADRTVEAMWLDCYLATNPRNQEIALFVPDDNNENSLLLPDDGQVANLKRAEQYFDGLPPNLEKALCNLFQNVSTVYRKISTYRYETEFIERKDPLTGEEGNFKLNDPRPRDEEGINKINRSETAHLFAQEVILNAVFNANDLQAIVSKYKPERRIDDGKIVIGYDTATILKELSKEFYKITRRVSRVLGPSKQYLKWVINRELAASDAAFDAGELVFAATSYGAINNWRLDERLTRACEKLICSLPDNGRLPTKRPFHANSHGYRMVPIGSEMTRALANLLQKTGYDFDAKIVDRMLKIFEENSIELIQSTAETKFIAWNFKDAPDPDKPSAWVTAISVLALDRIVRMLNTRINEIVLKHFDVIKPERPHTVKLHNLIYSDYGLVQWHFKDDEHSKGKSKLTAISLQKMRAHIMRATLPKMYQGEKKNFSAIFYGPPGTGKTTLAESLALSAGVPFVKLSPSDLIVQGQELLEGRARDVFEALSMLTQCVIIFDEFEPVLKSRKKEKPLTSGAKKGTAYDTMQISAALQKISQQDDPKFRFVLGGMLPKLGKLHDVAEKQSLIYCLGTNVLNDIDEAAKRPGRFDKQFAVYKPDLLSRAGVLFFRLSKAHAISNYELKNDKLQICRFSQIVALTANQNAEQISRSSFVVKKDSNGELITSEYLKYVFSGPPGGTSKISKILSSEESIKTEALKQINKVESDLSDSANAESKEIEEHHYIINSEKKFFEDVFNSEKKCSKDHPSTKIGITVQELKEYLDATVISNEVKRKVQNETRRKTKKRGGKSSSD